MMEPAQKSNFADLAQLIKTACNEPIKLLTLSFTGTWAHISAASCMSYML
jgi:hypothetical protein